MIKLVTALFLLLTGVPAHASAILILDTPNQAIEPGGTLTFRGSILNNNVATLDLNSINISISGAFVIDDTPFFGALAPISVSPSSSTPSYPWFTITVPDPYLVPYGVVNATVSILGGLQGPLGYDPTVLDLLGSANFSVTVVPPAAPLPPPPPTGEIPEPSTYALFATGAGMMALASRFRPVRG
jgi:hypothetical protein